jgi:pimeloyl-ACP methyl ester carboxylesterase
MAPWCGSAQLSPELGVNSAVVRAQQADIGATLQGNVIEDGAHASPELAVLLAGLSETAPGDPPAVARTGVAARDAAWWYGLRLRLGLAETYPHLVDLPRDYAADPAKRWPLILYLGNADDRGDDLQRVRTSGLAGLIHQGKQLPAVVVSPQCPADEWWSTLVLSRLLDDICAKYRVDPDRIYVTGISAGGDGAWALALAQPERLAAVIPICGESDPADAARLRDLPIWAFHGLDDNVVPVSETTGMIEAIRQAGGQPRLTLLPHTGHDAWDIAYADEGLYKWLFAQKRGQPDPLPAPAALP